MDYTGCCNEKLRERYGRAAPLVHALVIVLGHASALGLLLVPIVVPILFKSWVGHEQASSPTSVMAAKAAQDHAGHPKARP